MGDLLAFLRKRRKLLVRYLGGNLRLWNVVGGHYETCYPDPASLVGKVVGD